MIGQIIEENFQRAKRTLREAINKQILNSVNTYWCYWSYSYSLHNGNTTLTINLILSKYFETKEQEPSLTNYIDVLVIDYEDSSMMVATNRDAVCVTLNTVTVEDKQVIGIYSKDMTPRKEDFISHLVKCLDSMDIHVQKVDAFSGQLEKKDAQLIAVCLVHSRAMSDVKGTLFGIEDKFYKQIILVLLHFKQSDKEECASELKTDHRFSDMTIIDLFQQPDIDNTDDVYKQIIDAVNSYK